MKKKAYSPKDKNKKLKQFKLKIGWGAGIRTPINSSKSCCPTIRRLPIIIFKYYIRKITLFCVTYGINSLP